MEVEEMNIEDLFEDEAQDRDEDDPDEEGHDQVVFLKDFRFCSIVDSNFLWAFGILFIVLID